MPWSKEPEKTSDIPLLPKGCIRYVQVLNFRCSITFFFKKKNYYYYYYYYYYYFYEQQEIIYIWEAPEPKAYKFRCPITEQEHVPD